MNFPLMNRWKKMDRLESVTTSLQDYKMDYLLYITTIFRRMQQRLIRFTTIYLKLFLVIYLLDKKKHVTFAKIEFKIPRVNTGQRGGSRTATTSMMELFVIIVNGLWVFWIHHQAHGKILSGIRHRRPKKCPCRIRKTFIPNIGFRSTTEQ